MKRPRKPYKPIKPVKPGKFQINHTTNVFGTQPSSVNLKDVVDWAESEKVSLNKVEIEYDCIRDYDDYQYFVYIYYVKQEKPDYSKEELDVLNKKYQSTLIDYKKSLIDYQQRMEQYIVRNQVYNKWLEVQSAKRQKTQEVKDRKLLEELEKKYGSV